MEKRIEHNDPAIKICDICMEPYGSHHLICPECHGSRYGITDRADNKDNGSNDGRKKK
jgi:hypothetical protein